MIRAFQWDLARQVERLDWLLEQLPRYAAWGYQELYLHLEDAVDYPSLPRVARADAYSWSEFETLVAAAGRVGIGVVPIVNLLGHTQYLIKTPAWRDLNELRHADGSPRETGQICPLHPRTSDVAQKLLADVAPFCTTGKVHVGLDESFQLGRHPLSQAEVAEVGLATHFARYVQRLHDLAQGQGLRMGLWADMLALLPDAIPQLPVEVIAYDWYYHAFRHRPRFELFNYREIDLATPLRARGIEYWGCPMNGAFRFEPMPTFGDRLANITSWWRYGHRVGAAGMLVTSWESYRLAQELCTVVDAAAAGLWLSPPPVADDQASLLAGGFQRAQNLSPAEARRVTRAALACDDRAFAGYARWEVNDRWDTCVHRNGTASVAAEARFFARLSAEPAPVPFTASLHWRLYLARRDVFVRENARAILRLRRQLISPAKFDAGLARLEAAVAGFAVDVKLGAKAARAMWGRTRQPQLPNQNLALLAQDRARLKAWRNWLRSARRNPSHVLSSSVFAGRWNLQLTVHNVRPAVQRVVVQQQAENGIWGDLGGRFTIEFRTKAARPQSRLVREWSVPVEDPHRPLRISVRGVGEVKLSHVQLTDGRTTLPNLTWPVRRHQSLGIPATTNGWVQYDSSVDRDVVALAFAADQ